MVCGLPISFSYNKASCNILAKTLNILLIMKIQENNRNELERLDRERRDDFLSMLKGFVINQVYTRWFDNVFICSIFVDLFNILPRKICLHCWHFLCALFFMEDRTFFRL